MGCGRPQARIRFVRAFFVQKNKTARPVKL